MQPVKRYTIIIITAIILFVVALLWWLLASPAYDKKLSERIPGMDNRPEVKPVSDSVIIGEFFEKLNDPDVLLPGEWPRFRGSDFDNISKDQTPLAESWDTSGPKIIWRVTLGEGYSGAAVKNGRVYVLDYNEKRKADMLRCFSLKSGTELWRRWYNVDLKRNHGYARTIPAVTDKYVLTIGPRSHVMCVDATDGSLLWTMDLEKEFGIKGTGKGRITPDFYDGQCPLIDNSIAVIAPGGKALMTGIDCATGKIVWMTPNPDSLRMSHTSIMPMVLYGKKMYVYNGLGGVCGVSAEPGETGKILWTTSAWSPSITVASPVSLGNNEIAVFGSYGAGGARVRILKNGETYSAQVSEQHKASDGLASEQQTPILKNDFLWTVMPENAGPLKKQLVCFSKTDLLKPVWSSGKESRFGKGMGPYLFSNDKLYLLDDEGKLYMYKVNGDNATLISSHHIFNAIEAWAPMALAGRFLLIRDSRNLLCLDIGPKN